VQSRGPPCHSVTTSHPDPVTAQRSGTPISSQHKADSDHRFHQKRLAKNSNGKAIRTPLKKPGRIKRPANTIAYEHLISDHLKIAKIAMPRGSKPGERRGGRQKGTQNKNTLLRNSALIAAAADPKLSPLEYLLNVMRDVGKPTPLDFPLGVMRDPDTPANLRLRIASLLARYLHSKRSTGGPPKIVVDDPTGFSIDPALATELRYAKHRYHFVYITRISQPEHWDREAVAL
jgi:hypothetical protein